MSIPAIICDLQPSHAQRVGDVMPYYDSDSATYYTYYLKDVWNDATHERHPWHSLASTDLRSFEQLGEIIPSSDVVCEQDFAIGTGAVIEKDGLYYGFYTGHNPSSPSDCVTTKEGIMLATSSSPAGIFVKQKTFSTLYAPQSEPFDHQDNFRDPFVFKDGDTYNMIISARKDHNVQWRGVIARYISTDLLTWNYEGILYDGGPDNFFMMETAEIFKISDTYYLIFSDIDSKNVYYRKSHSPAGPWEKPAGSDALPGVGYAAKTVTNGTKRYILGWEVTPGIWAGELLVNEIAVEENGDLVVSKLADLPTPAISIAHDQITFSGGTLQESEDLVNWTDLPNPASPLVITRAKDRIFYRVSSAVGH